MITGREQEPYDPVNHAKPNRAHTSQNRRSYKELYRIADDIGQNTSLRVTNTPTPIILLTFLFTTRIQKKKLTTRIMTARTKKITLIQSTWYPSGLTVSTGAPNVSSSTVILLCCSSTIGSNRDWFKVSSEPVTMDFFKVEG